jgi:TctA family transporter
MIGAMMIQGIAPGPNVISRNPDLFWGLIASMWVGNAMLIILNLPLIGIWIALLKIPYKVLFPAIVAFCCIGVYSVDNSLFSVSLIVFSGIIGYFLVKIGCELPPFILGFILGPMLEDHLRRAMILSGGSPAVFFASPLSALLLAIAAALLIAMSLPSISRRRKEVFVED